jgi:hypothetical protein
VRFLDYFPAKPRARSDRLTHAAIVAVSTIAAVALLLWLARTYGSIRGGELFIFTAVPTLFVAVVALTIGLIVRRTSAFGKVGLSILCLAPALLFSGCFILQHRQAVQSGIMANFRWHLLDPIPASVTDIEPVESVRAPVLVSETCYALRFNIAPQDFDRLVDARQFKRVHSGQLADPHDAFNDPAYLKMGDNDELYQVSPVPGTLYTLRATEGHTRAIVRIEEVYKF